MSAAAPSAENHRSARAAAPPGTTSRFHWPPWLVGVAILLAVAAMYGLWHARLGQDRLVRRLVSTPLPEASYQGWKLEKPGPEIFEDKDPEEGQVGVVRATVTRSRGQDYAGFFFTVFKTSAHARKSYEAAVGSFTAPGSGKVIAVSGITGSCLGAAAKVVNCRGLVERTVVSLSSPQGESEPAAVATLRALVEHVSALER